MGAPDSGGDLRPGRARPSPTRAMAAMLSLVLLLVAAGEEPPDPPRVPKLGWEPGG